jgi:TPR repeat protein
VYLVANCLRHGRGCVKDKAKATELHKRAAVLGQVYAMHEYGWRAFGEGELDWERYYWWGRVAARGYGELVSRVAVVGLLSSFEKGERGRILHAVGALIRNNLDIVSCLLFRKSIPLDECRKLKRVVALHDAMLGRARRAIDCWSVAGRRCRVVKDIRVMISKMLWAEVWRWGEKDQEEESKKLKRGSARQSVGGSDT